MSPFAMTSIELTWTGSKTGVVPTRKHAFTVVSEGSMWYLLFQDHTGPPAGVTSSMTPSTTEVAVSSGNGALPSWQFTAESSGRWAYDSARKSPFGRGTRSWWSVGRGGDVLTLRTSVP